MDVTRASSSIGTGENFVQQSIDAARETRCVETATKHKSLVLTSKLKENHINSLLMNVLQSPNDDKLMA